MPCDCGPDTRTLWQKVKELMEHHDELYDRHQELQRRYDALEAKHIAALRRLDDAGLPRWSHVPD